MATSYLSYPRNLLVNNGDCVRFEFGDYTPPYNGAISATATAAATTAYTTNVAFQAKGAAIYLPMPSDIGSTITGNWQGKDITALASFAMGKIASPITNLVTTGKTENLASSLTNLLKKETFTQAAGALGEDALKALGEGFTNLPGLGANLTTNDVLALTSGVIINPNTELLYGGTGLRQHGYTFKLVPTSQEEARNVIEIVDAFKKATAPKKNTVSLLNTNVTNFLGLPDVCRVSFLTWGGSTASGGTGRVDENPHLPRYNISGINSVSVDYVVDGNYASFRDGRPVGVSLSVALTELKLLYSGDIGSEQNQYR